MPTDPTDDIVSLPSVIGFQVVPPSVVFHSPPPVAPNQYSSGRRCEPAAACERPPRLGPMLRQRNAASASESGLGRGCTRGARALSAVGRGGGGVRAESRWSWA